MAIPTYLPITLKTLSLFALATGTTATLKGLDSVLSYFPLHPPTTSSKTANTSTTTNTPSNQTQKHTLITSPESILADSQYRYFGSTWASYGGLLWWISNDIEARKAPLGILAGFMVLGGIGRAISGATVGFSHGAAKVATAVEFVGPALLWLVLR